MNERAGGAAGTALRDYACTHLDIAIARLGWRGGRLHAGVHQARKALRRTRATLALGAGALGPGADRIDRQLRRINEGLSGLRDAQALVETLDRQLAVDHDDATVRLLHRARRVAATTRATAARDAQAREPGLAECRARLRELRAAMVALPWSGLLPAHLRDRFADSQARMRRARRRAIASGRDDDWHRWRRRARRVSQQRRALAAWTLDGELAPGENAIDKRTAELLGAAQDLSLLLEHCGRRSVFSPPDRRALRRFAKPELARLRRRIARAAGRG